MRDTCSECFGRRGLPGIAGDDIIAPVGSHVLCERGFRMSAGSGSGYTESPERIGWKATFFAVFTMQSSNTLRMAATYARDEADDETTPNPWLLKTKAETMAYWGMILAVFALEIALKALLIQEGRKPCNTHNLKKLFEDLPRDTRQRLANAIPNLATTLDQHRNAFANMRYSYESGDGHPPMFTLEEREVLYAVSDKAIAFAMEGTDTGAFDLASLFDPGRLG